MTSCEILSNTQCHKHYAHVTDQLWENDQSNNTCNITERLLTTDKVHLSRRCQQCWVHQCTDPGFGNVRHRGSHHDDCTTQWKGSNHSDSYASCIAKGCLYRDREKFCLQVMVIENGAYGKRQMKICETLKIPYTRAQFPENEMVCPDEIEKLLR